ncbi:Kinesin-like protein KIF22-B [Hordeum vulgare]|nr:Kinesin-like protein KIF22-B [Hordeum vulgare]
MALDDKLGNLQLKVLAWAPVRSAEEFQEIYLIGVQSRKAAHTGLNDVSCRSHDVLSITVSNDTVKGRLNLIDLSVHTTAENTPRPSSRDELKTTKKGWIGNTVYVVNTIDGGSKGEVHARDTEMDMCGELRHQQDVALLLRAASTTLTNLCHRYSTLISSSTAQSLGSAEEEHQQHGHRSSSR